MDKDNKEPKKQNQSDYDVFGNRKASGKKKNSSSLRGLLDEEDSSKQKKSKETESPAPVNVFSQHYKKILVGALGSVAAAAVIGLSVAGMGHPKTEGTEAESTPPTETSVEVMALSPEGAQFPSLEVTLPTEPPAPEFIRLGVEHSIVAKLQQRLMELGFMDVDEPTEYFGNYTEAAVKIFQRQNNLDQDGIIGPATLPLLMNIDAKSYAAKMGDVGDDITRIQNRLYELGYLAESSMVSGTFDDHTEAGVRKLQQMNNLSEDGRVGTETVNLLYSDEVKANMLVYGEKSEVVEAVQKRLFDLGYMTTTPDGTYGSDTSIAVKAFQSKNDLVVDGYLGPSTRAVILSGNAKPNGMTVGDQSDQVAKVQYLLAKWGYMGNSGVTGYYGEATQAAVMAFQQRNGLSADGRVGAMTIAKLTSDNVVRPAASTPRNRGDGSRSGGGGGGGGNAGGGGGGGGSAAPVYTGGGGVGTMLNLASSKVGSPYVWGSKGPNAFDCSGFVYWVLNSSGVSQSYMTSSAWRNAGRYTRVSSFSQLQAGDIIVVSGHVGIVAGGGTVIDASSANGRVVQRSLSGWWQNNFIVGWRVF